MSMTISQKHEELLKFLEAGDGFDDILSLDKKVTTWQPGGDMWTIHQHMVHILDSELISFQRYRKAIAEPGGLIVAYDQDLWTSRLAPETIDLDSVVVMLKLVRKLAFEHLKSIVEQPWSDFWFNHSERGRVDLEQWLEMYVQHLQTHRDYIDRNLSLYAKKDSN